MSEILFPYTNDVERGYVSVFHKNDKSYYKKYNLHNDAVSCHETIAEMKHRYINWSDKTGFVYKKSNCILNLCHKRPRRFVRNPSEFDHTSSWSRPGDKWPIFYLTEPYSEIMRACSNNFDIYLKEYKSMDCNLDYRVFPQSEKSLWYPNATTMIFWFCPDYFDFDANKDLLFSHENACDFAKKCRKVKTIKK